MTTMRLIKIILLAAILSLGVSYLYAQTLPTEPWQGPLASPPNDNPPEFLHVGLGEVVNGVPQFQTKAGGLSLGGFIVFGNSDFRGNIQVNGETFITGTAIVDNDIDISDLLGTGIATLGKVLPPLTPPNIIYTTVDSGITEVTDLKLCDIDDVNGGCEVSFIEPSLGNLTAGNIKIGSLTHTYPAGLYGSHFFSFNPFNAFHIGFVHGALGSHEGSEEQKLLKIKLDKVCTNADKKLELCSKISAFDPSPPPTFCKIDWNGNPFDWDYKDRVNKQECYWHLDKLTRDDYNYVDAQGNYNFECNSPTAAFWLSVDSSTNIWYYADQTNSPGKLTFHEPINRPAYTSQDNLNQLSSGAACYQ